MNCKKYFLSLFAITAIATSCASEETAEHKGWSQDWTLYGDVESVTLTRYDMHEKFGKPVRGEVCSVITYDFNEQGDVIKESGQDNGFPMIWKNTYKYDSNGNMIESVKEDSWSCNKIQNLYVYDSNGKVIKKDIVSFNSLLCGSVVESDTEPWGETKVVYKYDSHGNEIERNMYRDETATTEKFSYAYDCNGNIIEKIEYTSEGSVYQKFIYQYDSEGRMAEYAIYYPDELMEKATYIYNSDGNVVEQTLYQNEEIFCDDSFSADGEYYGSGKFVYKYNSKGEMTEKSYSTSDGSSSTRTTCEYDSKGNRIKITNFGENSMPYQQTEIKIVYRK